jgi:type VI secretion system protein VasI
MKLLAIYLTLVICSSCYAEAEIFWRETETEKIKIKVEDKKETGRWTFPKEQLSKPPTSGKSKIEQLLADKAKKEDSGKWNVSTDINPLDDSQTTYLRLEADSGSGKYGKPIYLTIRDKSGSVDLFINWDSYISSSDSNVVTRVGKSKSRSTNWNISTSNTATFYRGNPSNFINELLQADKVVFQITPYNANTVTAIFDIRGLPNIIDPIMKSKGWRPRQ